MNLPKNLKVLLVAVNFFNHKKSNILYNILCLMLAFIKGNHGGIIQPLIYNLNKYYDRKDKFFHLNFNKIARQLAKKILESKCNIVAFSMFAYSDLLFQKTMALLVQSPNCPIILLGGRMICGNVQELKKRYPHANFFIESYGEKVFSNLRKYLLEAEENNNPIIKALPNFEELKSPYLLNPNLIRQGMTVELELRRGCPFNCSFCTHRNSDKEVFCIGCNQNIEKLLLLFKKKKVAKINVIDPCFNDLRTIEISKSFLNLVQKLEITALISLQIRPEVLTSEFLDIAKNMPNLIFEVGIQSIDNKVLPKINRWKDCSKVIQSLKELQKRRIKTEITLIYGLPNQTVESFKNDIDSLKALGFNKITAFPLQLYPGTELFEKYQDYGLEVSQNDLEIMQVCDNPTHDFNEMNEIAKNL